MKRLLIIGGSDAGISAALRARELRADFDVRVVVADRFPVLLHFEWVELPPQFSFSGREGVSGFTPASSVDRGTLH